MLEVFTQRNYVAEFIRFKLIFIHKNDKFTFLSHALEALGITYALHLQLVRKHVVDFLFAITELFSLALIVETL